MNVSQIIQAMAIPAFVIDRAHAVTHWNRACEKLTGIAAADMVGTRDAWRAFYPEKRPVLADLVLDRVTQSSVAGLYGDFAASALVENAFEARAFFPNLGAEGKWLYFTAAPLEDASGAVVGAFETFQDITEQRRAEEHYRLLLEAVPDPVVVYDPRRTITYMNEAFEQTYGWSREELIGGQIDFVPPEELENTKDAWQRTLAGEKVFLETRRKTKDGRVLDIQLRTAILNDHLGNHAASIVIHRDVTAIKQAEAERERLIDELQHALAEVKTLSGLIPICASCKNIRDDKGYWNQIEEYIRDRSEAEFSHGLCPDCARRLYPELDIDGG